MSRHLSKGTQLSQEECFRALLLTHYTASLPSTRMSGARPRLGASSTCTAGVSHRAWGQPFPSARTLHEVCADTAGICFPGAQGAWHEAQVRLICLKGMSCHINGLQVRALSLFSFIAIIFTRQQDGEQFVFVLFCRGWGTLFFTSGQFEPGLPDVRTGHFPAQQQIYKLSYWLATTLFIFLFI